MQGLNAMKNMSAMKNISDIKNTIYIYICYIIWYLRYVEWYVAIDIVLVVYTIVKRLVLFMLPLCTWMNIYKIHTYIYIYIHTFISDCSIFVRLYSCSRHPWKVQESANLFSYPTKPVLVPSAHWGASRARRAQHRGARLSDHLRKTCRRRRKYVRHGNRFRWYTYTHIHIWKNIYVIYVEDMWMIYVYTYTYMDENERAHVCPSLLKKCFQK